MTILLYDYYELEDKSSSSLKVWKVWHIFLFTCASIFGILNYIFLQNAMQLVDHNCVLFPRVLEFHMISRPNFTQSGNGTLNLTNNPLIYVEDVGSDKKDRNETVTQPTASDDAADANATIRETLKSEANVDFETTIEVNNVTVITGNRTHHLYLDTSRTLFGRDADCQFAEFTPVVSTVFSAVWLTMFTMCPRGGRVRTGLPQPWRILAPALFFSLIMVGVTGHSFTTTNGGFHAFCEAFYNVTNSTNCAPVNQFLEASWNVTWGFGERAAAARAASAGVWASWACAAALLLARCLAAPDFQVRRHGVYLTKDPQQKITPYLKKSKGRSNRSNQSSPSKRDNISIKSDPTVTTELATISVEPGQDSAPTSLIATPVKRDRNSDVLRDDNMIELAYTPQERGA